LKANQELSEARYKEDTQRISAAENLERALGRCFQSVLKVLKSYAELHNIQQFNSITGYS